MSPMFTNHGTVHACTSSHLFYVRGNIDDFSWKMSPWWENFSWTSWCHAKEIIIALGMRIVLVNGPVCYARAPLQNNQLAQMSNRDKTVKVEFFAGVIFSSMVKFSIFRRFLISRIRKMLEYLMKYCLYFTCFIFVVARFSAKSVKINVTRKFPLLQYLFHIYAK